MTESLRNTAEALAEALNHPESSSRLRAAMAAGTHPQAGFVLPLVRRCAVEPDFYVRETLTWALTRQSREAVIAAVLPELHSERALARSQALHTLSKVNDPKTWPNIPERLLDDADDEVARTAWRTMSQLAPESAREDLAVALTRHLGRGDRDLKRSLSRAFLSLGYAAQPVLENASRSLPRDGRTHALATLILIEYPEESFDSAMAEASRQDLVS